MKYIILESIKTFESSIPFCEIQNYFQREKKPFIVRKIVNSKIDLNFLANNFEQETIISLNPNSDKESLSVSNLVKKIKAGKKYRLRANTKLGNKITDYIDTTYIDKIKNNKKHIFDYLLSFGKTSRQKTLFLSTKNCTFTKHAHIISGLIIQLSGKKTWYVSNKREPFFSIKYKSLLNPNPLYVTDKNTEQEIAFTLNPGDLLYMPAYWFHYTVSHDTNISYSHFFTESIGYYISKTFLMFTYQVITNHFLSLIKAMRKEPEEHIYDKEDIIKRCNKIGDTLKRNEAIKFFKENDYS